MNSVIEQPTRAELHLDPNAQRVTRLHDDVRAYPLRGRSFETVLASRWASHLPRGAASWSTKIFDLIASETRHGGR
ncbi:MAG: hypothetical protein ING94_16600 [Rhodocyclaceae bacterium]|jgi:hypothetical protein|nr:hypothetical protein [Rhodocyclaceae bacterium]